MNNKLSGLIKTIKQQQQAIQAKSKKINIMQNNLLKLQKIMQFRNEQNLLKNMRALYSQRFWISNQLPGVRKEGDIKSDPQQMDLFQ